MAGSKKAIETDRLPEATRNAQGRAPQSAKDGTRGVGGGRLTEPIPQFAKAPCERVTQGANNQGMVMGRDSPASRMSGCGGKGDTGAGMIDLCVGRMGSEPQSVDGAGSRTYVDPNFKVDSARIYISQKTDIDENFGLVAGVAGNTKAKSAVAMKADGIRLIAREGIKLVTTTDKINSQGGEVESITGIDLIAGNDDEDMQPIPKGLNLENALKRIIHHMNKLNGIVDSLLMHQNNFNAALTSHFHFSPFYGIPTSVSPTVVPAGTTCMMNHMMGTKRSLISHKANLQMMEKTYLFASGSKYINSRYNNTN